MGRTEKLFEQPSALSNDLGWRSSVPIDTIPDIAVPLKRPRLIPLTHGYFATVDAEDYERIAAVNWYAVESYNTVYARRTVRLSPTKTTTLQMHRVIAGITDPKVYLDHKDGNGLNNSRTNIRTCNSQQNQGNSKKRKHTTSTFKGVCRLTNPRRWKAPWKAGIRKDGVTITIGYFANEVDAAKAYDVEARKKWGEFAKTNFPAEDSL